MRWADTEVNPTLSPPTLSPDGTREAVEATDPQSRADDIWNVQVSDGGQAVVAGHGASAPALKRLTASSASGEHPSDRRASCREFPLASCRSPCHNPPTLTSFYGAFASEAAACLGHNVAMVDVRL
jgi:hypothetical protein